MSWDALVVSSSVALYTRIAQWTMVYNALNDGGLLYDIWRALDRGALDRGEH